MSCFVLDPGGSREIGLCPHLQINPETHSSKKKIGCKAYVHIPTNGGSIWMKIH
jgi:hypothetical protein